MNLLQYLNNTPTRPGPFESLFKDWTSLLANGIEGVAALLIALAAIEATLRALWVFAHPREPPEAKEVVRLRLGRWLALALEFELAADIIRTAIAPTWTEIGLLAAIVIIRTAINYFLQRDIDTAAAQQRETTALRSAT